MTQNTIYQWNGDVANYRCQTAISENQAEETPSTGSKTRPNPAMLAQELASETSWADRYVPSTPGGTVMTPSTSSVADESNNVYVTPDEAPPTYESITSDTSERDPQELDAQSRALAEPFSQPQPQPQLHTLPSPLGLHPPFSQPQPHGLFPQHSDTEQIQWPPDRRYSRHETHSSITGTFTLNDELDLSTTSGSISIKLDVRPGPNPAILRLKTKSGSINVNDLQGDSARSRTREPSSNPRRRLEKGPNTRSPLAMLFGWGSRTAEVQQPPIPSSDDPRKQAGQVIPQDERPQQEVQDEKVVARVIHASIESSSGSVSGHLILTAGSQTRVTTSSGSINLRLVTADSGAPLPCPLSKLEQEDSRNAVRQSADLSSVLSTQSGSGSQNIYINHGFTDPQGGAIVSACRATHKVTGSGSLGIYYPKDWQGLVHASCGGSGSINVHGKDLKYDRRGNCEVYAWRGADEPNLGKSVELRIDGSGSMTYNC